LGRVFPKKEEQNSWQTMGDWKCTGSKLELDYPGEGVMFVPWTSKGNLVGRLKEEEERLAEQTKFKIKFQEEPECGKKDCKTCKQDDERKVDCFASSEVYQSCS
jgi:hypothetical protein